MQGAIEKVETSGYADKCRDQTGERESHHEAGHVHAESKQFHIPIPLQILISAMTAGAAGQRRSPQSPCAQAAIDLMNCSILVLRSFASCVNLSEAFKTSPEMALEASAARDTA